MIKELILILVLILIWESRYWILRPLTILILKFEEGRVLLSFLEHHWTLLGGFRMFLAFTKELKIFILWVVRLWVIKSTVILIWFVDGNLWSTVFFTTPKSMLLLLLIEHRYGGFVFKKLVWGHRRVRNHYTTSMLSTQIFLAWLIIGSTLELATLATWTLLLRVLIKGWDCLVLRGL